MNDKDAWTEAEYDILRPYFRQALGYGVKKQLLELLPGRTLSGIKFRLTKMRKEAGIIVAPGPLHDVPEPEDDPPTSVARSTEMRHRRCSMCREWHDTPAHKFRCKSCDQNVMTMAQSDDPEFHGRVR